VRSGHLADGTEYRIGLPPDWNGTVINDLDAAIHLDSMSDQAALLLSNRFAYSGTSRRPDRNHRFDPRAERDGQAEVLQIVNAEFGPERAIQFGCSGGGGVALGMAETYPHLIDGAISANGVEGIVMCNQRLDLVFSLKALLVPHSDLAIVGVSFEDRDQVAGAWSAVLGSAQESAIGRARIALAGSLAQLPAWGGASPPYLEKPDPADRSSVHQAMIRSTIDAAIYAARIRHLYDTPAGPMSWNTGIDYQELFVNVTVDQKRIIRELYALAGPSPHRAIHEDLERINAYPRIEGLSMAVNHWRVRALTANPSVPVLQVTTVGDSTRSNAMMAAYAEGVRAHGKVRLYRQALIDAAGHCTYAASEMAALVATMIGRLDRGSWGGSTQPDSLNSIGRSFGLGEPRFVSTKGLPTSNNRAFFPDDRMAADT
jgi:pimeloyl-ACP methyl ester carboxylesterase